MDVVFLGINDYGRRIYEWLCDRDGVDVQALLTEPDQLDLVAELAPDVVVASGFAHVVPPDVLAVPDVGCLNVHPGLLPETRGYNPNVWSIVEDRPAGTTIHYMDEGIDTGDVIARREVDRDFADTGRTLYERIERAAVELFRETWPDVENGTVDATPQDAPTFEDVEPASHVKADFADLCALDPDAEYTVRALLDRLRALTFPPFDNAHVDVDGERYHVEVSITPADGDGADSQRGGFLEEY